MMNRHVIMGLACLLGVGVLLLTAQVYQGVLYLNSAQFPPNSVEYFVVNPPRLLKKLARQAPAGQVEFYVQGETPYGEGFVVEGLNDAQRAELMKLFTESLERELKLNPSLTPSPYFPLFMGV